jgi:hypothetical protein
MDYSPAIFRFWGDFYRAEPDLQGHRLLNAGFMAL